MGKKRNRRGLLAARESGKPVRLPRILADAHQMEGFVLDVGEDWVLLQELWDFQLDGWCALRIDTIDEVGSAGNAKTIRRALKHQGLQVESIPVDLASAAGVVRSFARRGPLVTLHREAMQPGACWIGWPVEVTEKAVTMFNVDPRARWEEDADLYRTRDLTRIEVGGRYEATLHALAGYPPVG